MWWLRSLIAVKIHPEKLRTHLSVKWEEAGGGWKTENRRRIDVCWKNKNNFILARIERLFPSAEWVGINFLPKGDVCCSLMCNTAAKLGTCPLPTIKRGKSSPWDPSPCGDVEFLFLFFFSKGRRNSKDSIHLPCLFACDVMSYLEPHF